MRFGSVVLFVGGNEEETTVFERIFGEHAVVKVVQDVAELRDVLGDGTAFDIMLCGWSVGDATWRDALAEVQRSCPGLPVVVFSRIETGREWTAVLDAGAFDLLSPPYQEGTVLPVLERAITSSHASSL